MIYIENVLKLVLLAARVGCVLNRLVFWNLIWDSERQRKETSALNIKQQHRISCQDVRDVGTEVAFKCLQRNAEVIENVKEF